MSPTLTESGAEYRSWVMTQPKEERAAYAAERLAALAERFPEAAFFLGIAKDSVRSGV